MKKDDGETVNKKRDDPIRSVVGVASLSLVKKKKESTDTNRDVVSSFLRRDEMLRKNRLSIDSVLKMAIRWFLFSGGGGIRERSGVARDEIYEDVL